ncbi:MAG TPA: hypothetical protein VJ728_14270 [Candidatus Binataceae bacterium]|nr:hypothetical protein [Candidatus Binataceae bacterium]
MPANPVKRFVKKVLDVALVPIFRYAMESAIAGLSIRFENAAVRFDEVSSKLLSRVGEINSRLIEQAAAQDIAHFNSVAREQLRRVQSPLRQELAGLRAVIASQMPNNPCIHGFKVYAQTDEDGIIEDILGRLTGHSRTFIEIGCGNGLENNTHYLALKGYRGCWIDGSEDNIVFVKEALGGLNFQDLLIKRSLVDRENIGALISELCDFLGTREPGFFSLDIDGNDFYILAEALKCFRPLTICVEYTAKFPPPFKIAIGYEPNHRWAGDDYHGASLQSFCDLLVDYKLVACNLTGANAFFVRRDQAGPFADYTLEQLYQPFRENLIDLWAGHRPSLKWLRDQLHDRRM